MLERTLVTEVTKQLHCDYEEALFLGPQYDLKESEGIQP